MYDIHYHMIFGVDDGPKTIEASLELAEASIIEGVTHVVCTPHSSDAYQFRPEVNSSRIQMLNQRLGGRITLGMGCDFHLTYDNIEDASKNKSKYTINGGRYLLVEFPEFGISRFSSDVLFQFSSSGLVPIITHPERNPELLATPSRMIEWLRIGCLIQVTAGSVIGRFGKRAQAMSLDLIKKNWVHFIASDAHSMEWRPPAMAPAFDFLKKRFGLETAERLCIHNPRAAFFNENLMPNPDPIGVYEDARPKRGFFDSIFRRS
jgi:protein-tyrosine phosphatase